MASNSSNKMNCLQLAIESGSWKIAKECKHMSQDKKYRDVIEINGRAHTVHQ